MTPTRINRVCSIDGCAKQAIARQLCSKHYQHWHAHEGPNAVEHRERQRKYSNDWIKRNPDRAKARSESFRKRLKQELFDAYGHQCACCDEAEEAFLTLEHTNGDGADHRQRVGSGSGVYQDLKKRGWPKDGYEILCWNCNMARRYGNTCPHKLPSLSLVSA